MYKIQSFYIFCILLYFTNLQIGLCQINFSEHLIDDDTDGTSGIFAADLDNDNDIDILAASSEDDQIIWFRNDGDSPIIWTKIIIGANVGSAHSVYAADFDNDGDEDVVGAAYWGTPGIAWWRNDGGNPVVWTKFPVATGFINAHEVYVHDLDNDDDDDILGASSNLNTISWWRNDGGNPIVWMEQTISDNVTLAKSLNVGDFDNDGDNDVVGAAITAHDIIWWRNDGGNPIQWTEFLVDGNFIGAHRVQAIDMDNDEDLDILGAGYMGSQVAWWKNNGGNPINWTKHTIGTMVWQACIATACDIDNDDDLDVVATAQGADEVIWWRNDGNGSTSWTKFTITDNFIRPWPLAVADIDADEDKDIIVGSSYDGSMEIKWWENDLISTGLSNYMAKPEIHISPNPSNGLITIEGLDYFQEPVIIEIINSAGNIVFTQLEQNPNLNKNVSIDIRDYSNGNYIIRIIGKKIAASRKFIINNK